ncbi:MAG TPA: DUF6702 family protein [Bacteroidales bacterium]|nr:DUF6702 family protein [Bacteroidales bacterium]
MAKLLILPLLILLQHSPVTFTGIEHVQGTDSLKVTVRMSHELFLRDYQQSVFDDLDMEDLRAYKPFPSDLANNYINSKLFIEVNNKVVIGKLLDMHDDGKDTRFNMLYRVDKKIKFITVKNTILTGLYSDVVNLTIIKAGDYESDIRFTPEHDKETFKIR